MKVKRSMVALFLLALAVTLSAAPINWSRAKKIQTGVLWTKLDLTKPRLMKVNLIRVDLATPGLAFFATGRSEGWGQPMPDFPSMTIRTKRVKTVDFMNQARAPKRKGGLNRNVILAFNAAPWGPWTKPFNHKFGDPTGTNVSEGVVVNEHLQHEAHFVVYKNGKADIMGKISKKELAKINVAVGGFAIILKNGKETPSGTYEKALHPRIAYGLSKDRRYLYVITVDGRQPGWSLGANGQDLCNFFRDAGAWDAINMDGGGSTSLVYWDKRERKPVFLNHHKSNVQRNVASNVGIYLKKKVTPSDHSGH